MSTITSATAKDPVDGSEYLPISGSPKKKISVTSIVNYVLTFFTNKSTLDLLTVTDSNLQYNAIDINLGLRKSTQSSKSAAFTVTLGANSMLLWIYVHRGSDPITFKIGTTLVGDELLEETTISTSETFPFIKFLSGATIYITITDGDGDFEIMYIKSFHT